MKNKLLSMLLALAIAFGLWLYVITVVDPESEGSYYDIPVVFDGIAQLDSRDLMITSGTSVDVDLRLLGNRTDLNLLDKSNITILADLSRITEPGEHNVKYSISYPSSAGAIEVLEQDPQYITIHVSRRVRKEVPVRINHTGKVPENFVADMQNAVLDHTTVTVSGPEEVVDQIEHAQITVDLTNRTDNIVETHRHVLCDANGNPIEDVSAVTVNVSDIRVTVKVWQIKEIPLVIQVVDGGGLTSDDIILTPSHTSILVSGAEVALRGLDKLEFTIDLSQLMGSQVMEFPIELPENVTNESGITKVAVDVQVPEMTTKTLDIHKSRFVLLNVPEDTTVTIMTEILRVVIRGRENKLENLTEENITVYINVSEAVPGLNYYSCTIELSGVEDVGVYGESEYSVLAIVSQIRPGTGL